MNTTTMLIIGGLLLVVVAVLVYFFVFRKSKSTTDGEEDDEEGDDGAPELLKLTVNDITVQPEIVENYDQGINQYMLFTITVTLPENELVNQIELLNCTLMVYYDGIERVTDTEEVKTVTGMKRFQYKNLKNITFVPGEEVVFTIGSPSTTSTLDYFSFDFLNTSTPYIKFNYKLFGLSAQPFLVASSDDTDGSTAQQVNLDNLDNNDIFKYNTNDFVIDKLNADDFEPVSIQYSLPTGGVQEVTTNLESTLKTSGKELFILKSANNKISREFYILHFRVDTKTFHIYPKSSNNLDDALFSPVEDADGQLTFGTGDFRNPTQNRGLKVQIGTAPINDYITLRSRSEEDDNIYDELVFISNEGFLRKATPSAGATSDKYSVQILPVDDVEDVDDEVVDDEDDDDEQNGGGDDEDVGEEVEEPVNTTCPNVSAFAVAAFKMSGISSNTGSIIGGWLSVDQKEDSDSLVYDTPTLSVDNSVLMYYLRLRLFDNSIAYLYKKDSIYLNKLKNENGDNPKLVFKYEGNRGESLNDRALEIYLNPIDNQPAVYTIRNYNEVIAGEYGDKSVNFRTFVNLMANGCIKTIEVRKKTKVPSSS